MLSGNDWFAGTGAALRPHFFDFHSVLIWWRRLQFESVLKKCIPLSKELVNYLLGSTRLKIKKKKE